MKNKRCGRLGDHDGHEWTGEERDYSAYPAMPEPLRTTFWCRGHTVTEGGSRL